MYELGLRKTDERMQCDRESVVQEVILDAVEG